MAAIGLRQVHDPLYALFRGRSEGSRHPIPLTSTTFDVVIDSGIAMVTTIRSFENNETESIEATITFPVPVHAMLYDLIVRSERRTLRARARSRKEARDTYEDGLSRGHLSILHEEPLRGIHMLSVGHLSPRARIDVETTWAIPVSFVNGRGHLRIPLTVGQVYGRSPLPDSDDLTTSADIQQGTLRITSGSGTVDLVGGGLTDGFAVIPLNRPIDIVVSGSSFRPLRGLADGRTVTIHIQPASIERTALDLAVLVDCSGSMNESIAPTVAPTKHAAVAHGLRAVSSTLGRNDAVELWEFNSSAKRIGVTRTSNRTILNRWGRDRDLGLDRLVSQLGEPSGGTEIGQAIDAVLLNSSARDILLITDGKSHALDIHRAAKSGRRFSVVLIGEDSLEANVAHLAALTGGDIFIPPGSEVASHIKHALSTAGREVIPGGADAGMIKAVRSGAVISAIWDELGPTPEPSLFSRAVGAVATGLAIPTMSEAEATALCEAQGLVTHLTSFVLVDEETDRQPGLPATRKLGLADPAAGIVYEMATDLQQRRPAALRRVDSAITGYQDDAMFSSIPDEDGPARRLGDGAAPTLASIAEALPWELDPNHLVEGDISGLGSEVVDLIAAAASTAGVQQLAVDLQLRPEQIIIALMGLYCRDHNRAAGRVARMILGSADWPGLADVASSLGLPL